MILTNEFFSPTSTIPDQNAIELIDEFTFEPHVYIQYQIPPLPATPPFLDGIIRRERNNIYYLNKTVSESSEPLDVGIFGAKGNGTTDDTESINKAVLFLSKIGGGILSFNSNKKYLVSEPIFITNKVSFHCNGAIFRGNGTNTIMKTGYLQNDSLISNHQTISETNLVMFSQIKDVCFENCAVGLDFFNFCHGSSL